MFDFSAFIFVMVSRGNLLVSRVGVSLMISWWGDDGDDGDDGNDGGIILDFFILAAPPPVLALDGKMHLLYIVAVGRLKGIILHRWSMLSGIKLTCSDKMTNFRLSDI